MIDQHAAVLRRRLALTLGGACLAIAAFTMAVTGLHRSEASAQAQIEAVNLAESIATEAQSRASGAALQDWLGQAHALYPRDMFVLDRARKVLADSDAGEVGTTYHGDADGREIDRTLADGQPRPFVERSAENPAGARLIAVPVRDRHRPDGAIVGVVALEYSSLFEQFHQETQWRLQAAGAAGLLCILLVGYSGLLLHRAVGRMGRQLQAGRDELVARMDAERATAQRAEHMALHDSLTGLPNRTLFSRLLEQALLDARRRRRQVAVMFIDLDRFKNINDTLGHEAGDLLLKEIAARLQSSLRSSDRVARLGGDEFVLLVTDIEDEQALMSVAAKVIAAVARPCRLGDQDFRVTASVGVSVYPIDGMDEPTLMKHADIAMYQAKEEGKNTYAFYSDELNHHSVERLAFESNLRHALEDRQFELHYQPKVDCESGRVTGVEALMRWRHPDLGLVPPVKFIPVAEETGIIVPIGRWVLRTACRQFVAWRRDGLPILRMAVNLSGRQFSDDHLLDDVRAILTETGMPPDCLEVEITESVLMSDVRKTRNVLKAFRAMKIRVSVDDFGTGYSSLSNLKRFPVDTIKVDRSFVRDLANSEEDKAISNAIIAMGRTLGMSIVAEGVETDAQATILRAQGCDEIQGYFYSRPVPAAEIEQLMRDHPGAILAGQDVDTGPPTRFADSSFLGSQ